MSTGAAKMGGKPQTMDTEAGGEQTPYESIQTVTKPHSKESGQLGGEDFGISSVELELICVRHCTRHGHHNRYIWR